MSTSAPPLPYRDLASHLRSLFRQPTRKISIDAGLSCPNRDRGEPCIYCNERGSGTGLAAQGVSVEDQIVRGIDGLRRRYGNRVAFIAYFQSYTNTNASPERLRQLWSAVRRFPEIVALSVGTRPDCIGDGVMEVLAEFAGDYHLFLELGLQSADEDTLRWMRRGHGVDAFVMAMEHARRYPVETVAHVIIGTPGQTVDDVIAIARLLSSTGVQGVKPHLLYVPKGSALEAEYHAGRFSPIGRERYVELVVTFIEHLAPEIVIHRLTGDAHRGELVAPSWSADKQGVLREITDAFARRGTRQGASWTA